MNFPDSDMPFTTITLLCWKESTILLNTEGKMGCCGSGPLRGINTCGNQMGKSYELCENVTDYLFFDASHLTEKAHRQIAELIWSGPPNVTGPYNLQALFELN